MARVTKIDIYGYDKRLEAAEGRLRRPNPISARNAQLISSFADALTAEGISQPRIAKYIFTLKTLAEALAKNFDEAGKADISTVMAHMERMDYSPWTKRDFRVTLKRFYRWLKGTEEYPDEVSWIKTTVKQKDVFLPEDLLTEEEISKIVERAETARDRAFIMTLYESGARIGELGSMKMRDVSFQESYAKVMLNGKTGPRRVIVPASAPYLSAWMEIHPLRGDPDAPLWVNMGTVNRYQGMSYPGLAKVLKVACQRAGVKKRITPHKLRHSRATFLAGKVTEANMNQVFGWRQGSKMPSVYVHLSGRDVDDALLGVYGLRKKTDEKSRISPKVCPRCEMSNIHEAKFCTKCGLALDVEAAQELDAYPRGISAEQVKAQNIELRGEVNLLKQRLRKHEHGARTEADRADQREKVARLEEELTSMRAAMEDLASLRRMFEMQLGAQTGLARTPSGELALTARIPLKEGKELLTNPGTSPDQWVAVSGSSISPPRPQSLPKT